MATARQNIFFFHFHPLKISFATATHHICLIWDQTFENIDLKHPFISKYNAVIWSVNEQIKSDFSRD